MTLVDSSVWAVFISGRKVRTTAKLANMLRMGQVMGHESVYSELVMTATTPVLTTLVELYAGLPYVASLPAAQVTAWAVQMKLAGRGLTLVDLQLLASATTAGCKLWSEDTLLSAVAFELMVASDGEA